MHFIFIHLFCVAAKPQRALDVAVAPAFWYCFVYVYFVFPFCIGWYLFEYKTQTLRQAAVRLRLRAGVALFSLLYLAVWARFILFVVHFSNKNMVVVASASTIHREVVGKVFSHQSIDNNDD